ncbi:N-alpha-acetyltransferase 38, NatC auxiliary subunit [Onthophagus taurus]|uniref:N-alpha-acetyltransferase 38, NatC auxiliary subunit n=1 Tax=Onthophagus taurus TaxID=166361 RepID=UPI0039BDBCC0
MAECNEVIEECSESLSKLNIDNKCKDNEDETATEDEDLSKNSDVPVNMSPGAVKLRSWINQLLRITMSDGRVLVGMLFCTDRDANIILGACSEFLPEETDENGQVIKDVEEPRILGLVMVPGKHILNISVDVNENHSCNQMSEPLNQDVSSDEVM